MNIKQDKIFNVKIQPKLCISIPFADSKLVNEIFEIMTKQSAFEISEAQRILRTTYTYATQLTKPMMVL